MKKFNILKNFFGLNCSKHWSASNEESYQAGLKAGLHAGINKGILIAEELERERKRKSYQKNKLAKQVEDAIFRQSKAQIYQIR